MAPLDFPLNDEILQDGAADAAVADDSTPSDEYAFLSDLIAAVKADASVDGEVVAFDVCVDDEPTVEQQAALAALLKVHAERALEPYFTTHGRMVADKVTAHG